MSNIRVSPERIDGVVKEFSQAQDSSTTLISRLQTTILSLEAEWEGATNFTKTLNKLKRL
jgi:uncharacterized protein YukE